MQQGNQQMGRVHGPKQIQDKQEGCHIAIAVLSLLLKFLINYM